MFRVDARRPAEVTRLTADDGAYTDVAGGAGRRRVYALRSAVRARRPVRIDPPAGGVVPAAAPGGAPALPGTLTEVETTAEDGTRVRAWLALPEGASADEPGAAAAVDPRRSAGLVERVVVALEPVAAGGHGLRRAAARPGAVHRLRPGLHPARLGRVGQAPYTDLMAITDAAVQRADIDETRTAAMGGSFGGYMANWVAGHTDRFRAIVTHASLWALDQFGPTTDAP